MIHKNFQACYLQFHLYKLMRKMYHMMMSHCLPIFRYKKQSTISNFDEEIPLIKEKFLKADCPLRFITSVVNEFQKGKECGDESFVIPTSLFETEKPLIFI